MPTRPPRSSRRRFLGQVAAVTVAPTIWSAVAGSSVARAASASGRIRMVGDSLTVGSLPYQEAAFRYVGFDDIAIDAHGSRGIRTKTTDDPRTGLDAVDWLRSRTGDADLWVVALGTNDAWAHASSRYPSLIEEMLDRIGTGHVTMWVDVFMPSHHDTQQAWNDALAGVAASRPDEVVVHRWSATAASHLGWLTTDRIHYTGSGYAARSVDVAVAASSVSSVGPSVAVLVEPLALTATGPASGFVPMQPIRLIDTRFAGGRLTAGSWRTVPIPGDLPGGVVAVAINVTAVAPTSAGFLTAAGASSAATPSTSSLDVATGRTTAGGTIATIGDGGLHVYASCSTDLVVDLYGYFHPDADAGIVAGTPVRLLDTRSSEPPDADTVLHLDIGSGGGTGPVAAVLNLTAVDPTLDGHVAVWPGGTTRAATSCLNYTVGAGTVANVVQVGVGPDGRVELATSGGADVLVDLVGVYRSGTGAARFQPVAPTRVLDTRDGTGGWNGVLAPDQDVAVAVQSGPAALTGTLTATRTSRAGWLGVSDDVSVLNLDPRRDVSNATIVAVRSGRIEFVQGGGGGEHLVFDVTGRFVAEA